MVLYHLHPFGIRDDCTRYTAVATPYLASALRCGALDPADSCTQTPGDPTHPCCGLKTEYLLHLSNASLQLHENMYPCCA